MATQESSERGKAWKNPRAEAIRQRWESGPTIGQNQDRSVIDALMTVLPSVGISEIVFTGALEYGIEHAVTTAVNAVHDRVGKSKVLHAYVDARLSDPAFHLPDVTVFHNESMRDVVPEYFEEGYVESLLRRAMKNGNNADVLHVVYHLKQQLGEKAEEREKLDEMEVNALEALADDALSFETDPTIPKHERYKGDMFRSMLLKPAYDRYRLRKKDGYTSEHPSEKALDIAQRMCEFYLEWRNQNGMAKARRCAEETQLEKFRPAYYAELMTKTSSFEQLKAWGRERIQKFRGLSSTRD